MSSAAAPSVVIILTTVGADTDATELARTLVEQRLVACVNIVSGVTSIYRWKEGEAVIFDDAYEHEAWNKTPHTRVGLFVDFRKPLRFPANFLNWLRLNLAAFPPFIRQGMDPHKAREKNCYAESTAPLHRWFRLCPGCPRAPT